MFLHKIQSIPEATDNEKADKPSRLTIAEAENSGTVEHLKENLEITETTLSETIRALERAQAEQAIKAYLLKVAEETHSGIASQLEEKLKETQNRLKEKEDALEKVQAEMASPPAGSHVTMRTKYHPTLLKRKNSYFATGRSRSTNNNVSSCHGRIKPHCAGGSI